MAGVGCALNFTIVLSPRARRPTDSILTAIHNNGLPGDGGSIVAILVVGIALRKHVPLRAGVENPQHGFQNPACWDRYTTGTTVRNIFLRKVLANPLPVLFAQSQHVHNFTALHAAKK
jgi:hypothetical protein